MLLKKMGWKQGQGIGPRLTNQEKKQKNQKREKVKIYGCALPNQTSKSSDSESAGSDNEFSNITFAPDDYEPFR
jgi:G patch domain-containing protein 1